MFLPVVSQPSPRGLEPLGVKHGALDIRRIEVAPSAEEREAVDALLGAPIDERHSHVAAGGHAVRAQRHLLLPALHAVQARVGWISEGALGYVSDRLTIPPADVYGVATFYALLSTEPRPPRVLHLCDDIGCRVRGAEAIAAELERAHGAPAAHHTPGGEPAGASATWLRSPCLGLCDHAPAGLFTEAGVRPVEHLLGGLTPASALAALDGSIDPRAAGRAALPTEGDPSLRLLRRVGVVDPTSLDAYRVHGGGEALRRALEIGPDGVIAEVREAKLLGRGGAAFPTARKWEAVAGQPARPHYLVCNADESEPGTFKDRVLMEADPFAVIEAMTIAGFAARCARGFVYLRGEYPLALERLENAILRCREAGLLGDDVLGSGFSFDIEIRRGAGAYICGEETAIFGSIEGYRGEPRNKPPFPVEVGLFGKPTVVNNVETLANVPEILRTGGRAYAATGTADSTGTRLFCLSGNVTRPGVYEVVCGTRLGDLLALAGGVAEGRKLRAILLGGAAGGLVGPADLDVPLSFEGARAAGTTLGSGVVMVFDDRADLGDLLKRVVAFFRDESCGQCVPCRVGTVRQEEALHRILARRTLGSRRDEIALLDEIGLGMKDASICGLGQTAYAVLESAVKRLRLFDEDSPA